MERARSGVTIGRDSISDRFRASLHDRYCLMTFWNEDRYILFTKRENTGMRCDGGLSSTAEIPAAAGASGVASVPPPGGRPEGATRAWR
ncbi:hypothetical protein SAMN04489718_2047 [Actinopolyspora saharensis]|uniref:Uncharacterized protein n=1 Tax=Actinopolyspora saharensis TaxID=995062 RepID=A0A1H1DER4_9ACTN|nr:hypothetical protein SAMN04489718_2047 [Actinopolyspora saharensis]